MLGTGTQSVNLGTQPSLVLPQEVQEIRSMSPVPLSFPWPCGFAVPPAQGGGVHSSAHESWVWQCG